MTLEETIDKAITAYLSGEVPEKMSAIKPSKFDMKYFDNIENEMFPKEEAMKLPKDLKKKA